MTNQTEIFTIPLSSPLPYGDSTLTELKVRKPSASDLRGIKLAMLRETDAQILLDLLPRISLQPVTAQQLGAMSAVDTLEAMAVLAGFFLALDYPVPDDIERALMLIMAVLPGAIRIGEFRTMPLDDFCLAWFLASTYLQEQADARR